jgi:hypothetical protein
LVKKKLKLAMQVICFPNLIGVLDCYFIHSCTVSYYLGSKSLVPCSCSNYKELYFRLLSRPTRQTIPYQITESVRGYHIVSSK